MKIAATNVLSFADLSDVSTADLLAFYNERTGKNTTKFASRAKGQMQVWALIEAEVAAELAAIEAAKAAPAASEETAPVEKKARKSRGFRFKFCKRDTIKEVKEGSKRFALLQLLKQEGGATFEECMAETGWNRKDCYEGIRLLHYYVGYGLNMDETTGKIWIVE
ncbi:hypothetical protein AIIMSPlu_014 [Pseudomonas phage AIIMS-Plu-RaNi]|nr:hypothetical protein AIIMSPlu_014 [Pseudomonas phage AIIMS-Plu-RaNi]